MYLRITFVTTFALLVLILVLAFCYRATEQQQLQFELWTNAAYLWPLVRAIWADAWHVAAVLYVTFAASTVHHGCVSNVVAKVLLSRETHLLLVFGTIIVIIAATQRLIGSNRRYWYWVSAACLVGLLVVTVSGAHTDSCFYDPASDRALVTVWDIVDYVTAGSAFFAVSLYFLAVPLVVRTAVFWLFAALLLIIRTYRNAHVVGNTALLSVIVVSTLSVMVLWGLWIGCVWTRIERKRWMQQLSWYDVVGGLALGTLACLLFVFFNGATGVHGWWHVTGAAAMILLIDAVK